MKKTLLAVTLLSLSLSFANAKAKYCKDFPNQSAAQQYFESRATGSKRLDHDKDGEACECLQGGSGYNKSTCTRWRKKNGK